MDFKDTPDAADLPLVVLLERLHAQGWTAGRDVRSAHEARGPLKFDASPGFRHRPLYFQVVLTIRDLFRAGVTCVHVRQSDKYYQLVLMHKRDMPPNLPTKSYAALLAGKSLDEVLALPLASALALRDRDEEDNVIVGHIADDVGEAEQDDDDDVDSVIVGLEGHLERMDAHDRDVAAASDTSSNSDSDESGSASSTGSGVVVELRRAMRYGDLDSLPATVEGQHIYKEEQNGRRQNYVRLKVNCPRHDGCSKRRSVSENQCRRFGILEPVCFLGAWLQTHCSSKTAHIAVQPTLGGVATYFREHFEKADARSAVRPDLHVVR